MSEETIYRSKNCETRQAEDGTWMVYLEYKDGFKEVVKEEILAEGLSKEESTAQWAEYYQTLFVEALTKKRGMQREHSSYRGGFNTGWVR